MIQFLGLGTAAAYSSLQFREPDQAMSDAKSHQFRPPLYHAESNSDASTEAPVRDRSANGDRASGKLGDQKGWEAYRKWLSSVSNKPASERTPIDASIYSWKGYHNWADRVRQTWKSEDS